MYKLDMIYYSADYPNNFWLQHPKTNELVAPIAGGEYRKLISYGAKPVMFIIVSDEELKNADLFIRYDTHINEVMSANIVDNLIGTNNYKTKPVERNLCHKVVASSSSRLTPNSFISLTRQKEIAEHYNLYNELPLVDMKLENESALVINSEIQFKVGAYAVVSAYYRGEPSLTIEKPTPKMDEFLDKVDSLCRQYGYEFYPTTKGWTGKLNEDGEVETFACIGNGETLKLLYLDGDGRGK